MTKQFYDQKIKELENQLIIDLSNLKKEYAEANNPYKVGDVITDHFHSIRITGMTCIKTTFNGCPEMLYKGIELKKDGTPAKRQQNTTMHQSNIDRPKI